MRKSDAHLERHHAGRTNWLRAAVLGSNDAIVSTASLMMGVTGASGSKRSVLIAGVAGLAAGALSMAVGEFVSVSSQRDVERADIELEKRELATQPRAELMELAAIYQRRGLDRDLAMRVATQLTERDQLGAHLRDELGIDPTALSQPLQAAWVSAASFASFAALPIVALWVAPPSAFGIVILVTSLFALVTLGAIGARLGGAPVLPAVVRVAVGGAVAMAVTDVLGRLLGATL